MENKSHALPERTGLYFTFCLKPRNGVLLFFLSEYGQNKLQCEKHDHHILSKIQVSITQTGSLHFRKSYKTTRFLNNGVI